MRFDHVIYATRDLDDADARIRSELGLTSIAGGRHEGLGTHEELERWLGGLPASVRVVPGPPAVLAMGIGERELRPARRSAGV